MQEQEFKRHTAYKLRIGEIVEGKPIMDGDKFKFAEIGTKRVVRVNIIANITDKFIQDDEKKYATITLDDASGQIRIKTFGEDIEKLANFSQGDTVQIIGILRTWNNEIYVTPEIIKKRTPEYLLLRKLETDLLKPKVADKGEISALRENIVSTLKKEESNGGVNIEDLIITLKSTPEIINTEIRKLLEEGIAYEPRPGKLRYLG